jgi:rubrerythrin
MDDITDGSAIVASSPVPVNGGNDAKGRFLALAMQIEVEGRNHYLELFRKIPLPEISGIFRFLADEEQRHYEIFHAWQRSAHLPSIDNTQVLVKALTAFQKLWVQFREAGLPAMDYREAYEKALSFEKKSADLYEAELERIDVTPATEPQRTVLKNIIHQEKGHALLITSLMEFNRAPGEWLENAEWYHLDEF